MCTAIQVEDQFNDNIRRGLLKYAHDESASNKKAQVFRAICKIAREYEEISVSLIKQDPLIRKILESSRHVELYMLKTHDMVIYNTRKGHYSLTQLGQQLSDVFLNTRHQ